jgi:hypothetical protein
MSIRKLAGTSARPAPLKVPCIKIGLLTGGDDKTYAVALATSLAKPWDFTFTDTGFSGCIDAQFSNC